MILATRTSARTPLELQLANSCLDGASYPQSVGWAVAVDLQQYYSDNVAHCWRTRLKAVQQP